MGILMNKICCIDNNEIFENTNFKNTLNDTYRNEDDPSLCSNPSSELKSLPFTDINLTKDPKMTIKSLSRLPISTKNVIRQQSGNPFDYYRILKKLGQGTFGQVYKTIHKKTGNIRAMKIIPKNNAKPGFTDKDIIHEIMIMKNLDHPHIIKLYEFYTDEYNYYLINEFCTEGDLSEKMYKLKSLPEPIVKIIMAQIFNAVLYLNNKGIIHGDLKLENIMIDSFLNKDELTTPKGKKCNFIQSLLEDEKEINEYLRQKELKRSSTFHDFGMNGKLKNKINKINQNDYNTEFIENNEKLIQGRKRGKTINKSFLSHNNLINKLNEEKRKNKINKEAIRSLNTLNNINGFVKQKPKKSDFSYLNGEDDDEEDQKSDNDLSNDSPNNNGEEEIENGKKKMFNIKAQNENFIKNQLEMDKLIKEDNQYLKFIKENSHKKIQTEELGYKNQNNSGLKKTLTLKSMKMKNFELKLIDFGCAKIFSKSKKNFEDTIGTLIYCSPEVLRNNYNKQCDIWSCGVIMYVLLSGHFPFFGKTEEDIKNKILSGKFSFNKQFLNVSEKAKDLIRKCLMYDKNRRITAEQALKHEFFADDINPHNIFEDDVDSKNVLISLKNYSQQSKIYQTVLAFLSHNFADKLELNKLKKIFYKIDLNLDGKLSKDELFIAFKEAGMEMKNDQLNKVIESIDFDGNGYIEYEEFIRVTLPKEQLFTEDNLKSAFDMFDLDKNGTISLNEFKEILGIKKVKDKNVNKELLKEIPIHGDEEMTFEQFKKILIG